MTTSYEERLIGRVTEALRRFFNDESGPPPFRPSRSTGRPHPQTNDNERRHCRTCRCFETVNPVMAVRPYRPDTPPVTPRIVLPDDHHEPLAAATASDDDEQGDAPPAFADERLQPRPVGRENEANHPDGPEGRWLVEANDGPIVISDEENRSIGEGVSDDGDWSLGEEGRAELARGFLEEHDMMAERSPVPSRPVAGVSSPRQYSQPGSDYSQTPEPRPPDTSPSADNGQQRTRRHRLRKRPVYRRFNVGSSTSEEEGGPPARRRRCGSESATRSPAAPVPSTSTGGPTASPSRRDTPGRKRHAANLLSSDDTPGSSNGE